MRTAEGEERESTGEMAWVPLGEIGGRRTVFSCRTGSLWPSAGTAMRGMAREYAAGDSRGPGWGEFSGTLAQLQAGLQAGPSGWAFRLGVEWLATGPRRD